MRHAWPRTTLHDNIQARLKNRTAKRVILDLGAEDICCDQMTRGGKSVLAIVDADVPMIQPLLVDAITFGVQVRKNANRRFWVLPLRATKWARGLASR
jgi:hypothetical protein